MATHFSHIFAQILVAAGAVSLVYTLWMIYSNIVAQYEQPIPVSKTSITSTAAQPVPKKE